MANYACMIAAVSLIASSVSVDVGTFHKHHLFKGELPYRAKNSQKNTKNNEIQILRSPKVVVEKSCEIVR